MLAALSDDQLAQLHQQFWEEVSFIYL